MTNLDLALDSAELELFGQGKWDTAKHGRKKRRWMKLHVAVDATTGKVAAHVLTDNADNAAGPPALLGQAEGTIVSVTADGRYKHLIGPRLFARTAAGQRGKVALAVAALNRMIRVAKSISVRVA